MLDLLNFDEDGTARDCPPALLRQPCPRSAGRWLRWRSAHQRCAPPAAFLHVDIEGHEHQLLRCQLLRSCWSAICCAIISVSLRSSSCVADIWTSKLDGSSPRLRAAAGIAAAPATAAAAAPTAACEMLAGGGGGGGGCGGCGISAGVGPWVGAEVGAAVGSAVRAAAAVGARVGMATAGAAVGCRVGAAVGAGMTLRRGGGGGGGGGAAV